MSHFESDLSNNCPTQKLQKLKCFKLNTSCTKSLDKPSKSVEHVYFVMMCKLLQRHCLKNKHERAALVQAEKKAWQEAKSHSAREATQINKYR